MSPKCYEVNVALFCLHQYFQYCTYRQFLAHYCSRSFHVHAICINSYPLSLCFWRLTSISCSNESCRYFFPVNLIHCLQWWPADPFSVAHLKPSQRQSLQTMHWVMSCGRTDKTNNLSYWHFSSRCLASLVSWWLILRLQYTQIRTHGFQLTSANVRWWVLCR